MKKEKIGVIGGGSWGTAISYLLAKNDHFVCIWSRNIEIVESINKRNINELYFDDLELPKNIYATSKMEDLFSCDYLFMVLPTQAITEFFSKHKIPSHIPIILCNKGIDLVNLEFTSEILGKLIQNDLMMLSGPNFAREIMQNLPARANIIGTSSTVDKVISLLHQDKYILKKWDDLIGAEICGALKNVLAIGCGILQSMGLGENAKAWFITEGIAEITKLITSKSGKAETIMQYCGIGDILLTCNSTLSRNMNFGYNFVQSGQQSAKTVEGFYTAKSASLLAHKLELDLPIMNNIYDILYNNKEVTSLYT